MHARIYKALDTLRIRCFARRERNLVRGGAVVVVANNSLRVRCRAGEKVDGSQSGVIWEENGAPLTPNAHHTIPCPREWEFLLRHPTPLHTNANRASLESEIRSFGPQKLHLSTRWMEMQKIPIFWLIVIKPSMQKRQTSQKHSYHRIWQSFCQALISPLLYYEKLFTPPLIIFRMMANFSVLKS